MIKQEKTEDGQLYTYSSKKMKIRQKETGIVYDEALDVMPCKFTYEETDIPLPEPEEITDNITEV